MSLENLVETDVLVIGGGIAGCFAAIKAREQGLNVTLVDKAYAGKSGAGYTAQTAWMVFNPEWGLDFNACMNALNVGCEYINNRQWCEIVLKESLAIYQDLVSWGAEFPPYALKRVKDDFPPFGTISFLRNRKQTPALRNQAKKVGVRIMDRIMVTDLLKNDGKTVGAISFCYDTGDLYIFKAKATVLSAGANSFKPGWEVHMNTGDADAMAYRAGAEITGKEFPDTHMVLARFPSWRFYRGSRYPNFHDVEGERMPTHVDLWKEFAIHAGKGPIVWDLDVATDEDIERVVKRDLEQFSGVEHKRLVEFGFDIRHRGKHPIAGGASAGSTYHGNSGIWLINTKSATGLPGLYAAGDCGGSRLLGGGQTVPAGLIGAAVTGKRAGAGATEYALRAEEPTIDEEELARLKGVLYAPMESMGGFSPRWVTQLLQNTMIPYFILYIKHEKRLQAALTIVEFLRDHLVPKLVAKDAHELRLAHETKNMVLNAEMILRASLFRTESRGTHYREDYPRREDPAWLAWIKLAEEQGRMKPSKEPIPKKWWPDLSKPYEEIYPVRFPGE